MLRRGRHGARFRALIGGVDEGAERGADAASAWALLFPCYHFRCGGSLRRKAGMNIGRGARRVSGPLSLPNPFPPCCHRYASRAFRTRPPPPPPPLPKVTSQWNRDVIAASSNQTRAPSAEPIPQRRSQPQSQFPHVSEEEEITGNRNTCVSAERRKRKCNGEHNTNGTTNPNEKKDEKLK